MSQTRPESRGLQNSDKNTVLLNTNSVSPHCLSLFSNNEFLINLQERHSLFFTGQDHGYQVLIDECRKTHHIQDK